MTRIRWDESSSVSDPMPPLTIYGKTLSNEQDYTSTDLYRGLIHVPSLDFENGSVAYGCSVVGDKVYVGNLTASGNSFQETYLTPKLHVFDSPSEVWTSIELETDLGHTGVVGPNGFSSGDYFGLCDLGDGRCLAVAATNYNDWVIATYGRYPAWIELQDGEITAALSIEDLYDLTSPTLGDVAWPMVLNSYSESYHQLLSMVNVDVLPNGWVVVACYIGPLGSAGGQVLVFDPSVPGAPVLVGVYQVPDMELSDGTLCYAGPKFVAADPSHTDPDDLRFLVTYDLLVRSTNTQLPFPIQEFSIDSDGTITPVTIPIFSPMANVTTDFSDFTGSIGEGRFDHSGNVWVDTGIKGTFQVRPECCFLLSSGERSWRPDMDTYVGWETDLGSRRAIPDFAVAVPTDLISSGSGLFFDSDGLGFITVGISGGLWSLLFDSPLELRLSILSNSLFASNIVGWSNYGLSGSAIWDSGDSGRMKNTSNGSAINFSWQTDGAGVYSLLPVGSDGQTVWAWARIKTSIPNRFSYIQINYYDDSNNLLLATSGNVVKLGSDYTKVLIAASVPVGATKYKVFVSVNNGLGTVVPNGEIYYMDEAYLAIAPVTVFDHHNMDQTDLPLSVTADGRWPQGSGNKPVTDSYGFVWFPIRIFDVGGSQPQDLPQYLVRVSIDSLLGVSTPSFNTINNEGRLYNIGLDRGVLYLEDQSGVPWNGLLSVDEVLNEFGSDPLYFDGIKFNQVAVIGSYSAKLKAYTYPDEFSEHDGYYEAETGLYVDNQQRAPFGLSYRTLVGDDVVGEDLGYEIHILYNLVSKRDTISHDTVDSNIDPIEFGWSVTSKPVQLNGYAPTAHVIADSRYLDPSDLEYIEGLLYGTDSTDPHLPDLEDLTTISYTIIITDHGDGTWSADGPDELITMLEPGMFQITEVNAVYLDPDTYEVSST